MNANVDWPVLETTEIWAVRTSLEALPLALAALLLGRLRACPPTWRVWLLALFFLRLALPAVPAASWHPWAMHPSSVAVATDQAGIVSPGAATSTPLSSLNWKMVLACIWLSGAAVSLGWLILSHMATGRYVRQHRAPAPRWLEALADWARERQGARGPVAVYVVPRLSTMAIFGWWRPCLLVPDDVEARYTGAQIRGMLLHEFTHVRRFDVLWSWLALIICAVHWFNPVAWLAFRRFSADRELICDAAALERLDDDERYSYGDALLRSLAVAPMAAAPSLAPFFRIHPEIKHRILMITAPVSPSIWSRLAAVLLLPALCLLAFTTSRGQTPAEPPKSAPENAAQPAKEGEKPKAEARDGEKKREGERPRNAARDGENRKAGPRDGEVKKEGPRDGEAKKEGARDGDKPRSGARDGDKPRAGAREGERPRRGARDGEMKRGAPREGDGDPRKPAPRDGERPRDGARDGEGRKPAPRDGEETKAAPRDGEKPREADGAKREQ